MGRNKNKRMKDASQKARKSGSDLKDAFLKSEKIVEESMNESKPESIESILDLLKKYSDERDAMCSIRVFSDGEGSVHSNTNGHSHIRFYFKSIGDLKNKLNQ